MSKEDIIADSLGLEPLEKPALQGEIVEAPRSSVPATVQDDAERDYQYARDNFYNVIEKGSTALEEMLDLAKASEHPRAYEVVSTIMKTLVDANKDLVSMSEKKAEEKGPAEDKNVTNNNLFVGSTAELQKMLKDMKTNESSDG